MSASKRPKPLYQRGRFSLVRREGRQNLEIVWYDTERKRERTASTGTGDVQRSIVALDRRYLEDAGQRLCPTCHRAWDSEGSPRVVQAITDYLITTAGKGDYVRHRLAHVLTYLEQAGPETVCAEVDEKWIARFRDWLAQRPVTSPKGKILRRRSLAHIEGSVMQLAAAINAIPGESAKFAAIQQISLSRSPVYRADIETLAAMFRYCLRPDFASEKMRQMAIKGRVRLLSYLRLAVATWARPDAIMDVTRAQWHPVPQVLDLNPPYRTQTDKRRPVLPIARQMVPHLNAFEGNWIEATTIRAAWDKMRVYLDLPSDREAGPKLIRRTMATLARKRMGEVNWRQGEIWLGHQQPTTSDIYAVPDPANLGIALATTEQIIDEIEALAPGAYRTVTAQRLSLMSISGGKNG